MTHPPYLREKARAIRVEKRLTIDEIAERLALPRTTIYHWVKDIPIPRARPGRPFPSEAQRRGNDSMREKYRLLRESAYARGASEFDDLCAVPTFREFVCLYLAEGYKRTRHEVAICNSDPAIVALADRWIRRLAQRPPAYCVQYHADQDLRAVQTYWGEVVGVPPERIGLQRKSNSGRLAKRTWRSEHGVLTIRIGDTLLRARLQAWTDRIRAEWV
ncbi:MAG: hypothetical protein AVDCRST_MAG30-3858 [uncultured Solirubrobacteraceae bacterium]|uniref:Uncharacterized protein n=1 Tax=uncultured Solirubrobacteraceae bacterium TaxID=1162706 RepID=A0A6J4TTE6_9ACTN|nr:MAG: hypothetical protein AVDCRST_MAG30-3858 [uncultured Solirubrobacteraceae bacterium]